MIKKVLALITLIYSSTLLLPVYAQTPTATDSATAIRNSVKQQVDQELSQIKQGVAKKGFIGTIASISDASLSLTNLYGQTRKVFISAASTIKLANGADGTPADLKPGQYILVMGNVDSTDTMTASRLLIVAAPVADTRTVIFGAVVKASATSFTVGDTTYKVTSTTKFTNSTKNADVVAGAKVMAIVDGTTAVRVQLVTPAPSATNTPAASSSAAQP